MKGESGVSLPNFRGIPKNNLPFDSNFNEPWNIEFFCEPDWIISFFNHQNNESSEIYLNELNFKTEIIVSSKSIKMHYAYDSTEGSVQNKQVCEFKIDIRMNLNYKCDKINTSILIQPTNEGKYEVTFVAQDAAYMWFPFQNQTRVKGFTIMENVVSDELSFNRVKSDNSYFGTYCSINWVYSGFEIVNFHNMNDYKVYGGILNGYLFVPEHIPIGYQISANKYGNRIDKIIQNYDPHSLTHNDNTIPLISRFISMTNDDINNNNKFQIKFKLFMGVGDQFQSDNENILNKINSISLR